MTATYHTTGEIDAARETLLDIADQINNWIDALETNKKRADEQGHDRQVMRLEDAQIYYQGVLDGIITQKIVELNHTEPQEQES